MFGSDRPCVLLSGGLDSAVALAEAARDRGPVLPVYVRSGLVWEPAEMYWTDRFLQTLPESSVEPLVVLDLPAADLYGDHWSVTGLATPGADTPDEAVYLPGRNLLLLSKVGVFAARRECGSIVSGSLASNPFPDGRRAFFDTMGETIGLAMGLGEAMPIETPLEGLEKPDVVRRGAHWRLDLTFSCIDPQSGHRHCGVCNKCAERRWGFEEAGVADPTAYARDPAATGPDEES
ncbi:MAG: 7-cyano-7-deazaguanine synthase [Gemmatimonadota bacterium]|nr:7-cyano-7-deazaguanine synthase [Gemmatimonadota bacterium]